jgi:hypothetical protein
MYLLQGVLSIGYRWPHGVQSLIDRDDDAEGRDGWYDKLVEFALLSMDLELKLIPLAKARSFPFGDPYPRCDAKGISIWYPVNMRLFRPHRKNGRYYLCQNRIELFIEIGLNDWYSPDCTTQILAEYIDTRT